MLVRILNPILASLLLMAGIWLATVNVSFGLMAIIGGLLLGFSTLRHEVETMHQKTKWLFYGSFIFLLLLFSITFLVMTRLT